MENIYARIEEIKLTPIDKLITNSKKNNIGVLLYKEIEHQIESFKTMLNYVDESNFKLLPDYRSKYFERLITPILNNIDLIQNTDLDQQQSVEQQKRRILDFFKIDHPDNQNMPEQYYYQKYIQTIWSIIVESLVLKTSSLTSIQDIEKKKEDIEKAYKSIKSKEKDALSIIDSARTELSKGGVGKHKDIFDSQARFHDTQSKKWQNATIIMLSITIGFILMMFFIIVFKIEDLTNKIETGIFSALLISFLSYGIVLCVKNYFAEKHNQMVNQHKANCLGTYNTFIDSADQDRKQAILQQATNTIFSHQKSGYLAGESDNQNPNPVIEIVKNISSKSIPE